MAKFLRNRFEPRRFGLMVECVVAVDNFAKRDQRRGIFSGSLRRSTLALLTQLNVLDVVGNAAKGFRVGRHLVAGRENELGVLVDVSRSSRRSGSNCCCHYCAPNDEVAPRNPRLSRFPPAFARAGSSPEVESHPLS